MKTTIREIIRKQQPEIYKKLRSMIVSAPSKPKINPGALIKKNLGNTGLDFREQPEDPEQDPEFRKMQRLVTERKAVEI